MTRKEKTHPSNRKARLLLAGLFLAAVAGKLYYDDYMARQPTELTAFAMGSYVEQTLWGPGREQAAEEVPAAVTELENRISWRRGGEIAQINQQAGKEHVLVCRETQSLLEEMRALCKKSGGALDVTIGPVSALWSFDDSPSLPEPEAIAQALPLVDYTKLSLDWEEVWTSAPAQDGAHIDGITRAYTVQLADPAMSLDLGAIGKGAACDTAIALYREFGVTGAVIAVGGSVGLWGQKPDGKPFRVSVRDPAGTGSLGVLELSGGFVSTSGSYEKFFQQDGRTYCHLLDPRTGYPAESGLVSVTVWCPPDREWENPGALSDGLATACFVLGLEDSLPLLEAYGAQALFVEDGGQITLTDGLSGRFTLREQDPYFGTSTYSVAVVSLGGGPDGA